MRPHILRVLSAPAAGAALLALALPGAGTARAAAAGQAAAQAHPATAYVLNLWADTVTPVNTATNTALKAIPVGHMPFAVAITPDGKTVYVNGMSSAGGVWGVTPISTAANKAGRAVTVSGEAYAFAITPDSRTVYVADIGANTVIPINTAANKAGNAIPVGHLPIAVAITPNGKTAYVANSGSGTVTPITIATGKAGKPVKVGAGPRYIAITPNGKTAYVANSGSGTVTPVTIATGKAGKPITVGRYPAQIAVTPNGKAAYVANRGSGTVTPIIVATGKAGKPVKVGSSAMAITPDGRTLYTYCAKSGTVTAILTATNKPGKPIKVGGAVRGASPPPSIAITPDGRTVYTSAAGLGVTPVSTATGKVGKTIDSGGGGSIAITPAPRPVPPALSRFQPAAASFWSPGSGMVLGAVGCTRLPCRAQLVTTGDGGRHWQIVSTPALQLAQLPGTGRVVTSVLFANRRDGWLYGGTGLWFTSDGGAHWRQLTLAGKVTAMAAVAGTAYAAVARPAGKTQELFRSPVTRAAWARVGTMTAASPLLAVAGRAAWFANGTPFGSPPATYLWATPDGTHWHRYPFACANGYGLKAITAATPSHLAFLCTGSGFAGGEGKEVMTSADGGRTAHLAGPAPLYGHPTGFAAPPGRPQVITIANTGSGIFTSANAGKNWTSGLIDTSGEPLNSLAYTSPTTAWVVLGMPGLGGRHGLLRTANQGRTWQQVSF